ncbi:tRNA pseudouridine synthase D (TruD) [Novymonas esmeraldas]|uniref:tRNA pseudouridine synthase D (TruD) n=1 Tax=Novymonas esmeraldas TaxID=1808958 RepID=A0AAW0ENK2_9TRYP
MHRLCAGRRRGGPVAASARTHAAVHTAGVALVEPGSGDAAVGGSGAVPWREWPTKERLERIDTLAHLLGRYQGRSATDTTTTTTTSPASRGRSAEKKSKLAVLNARAVPTRAPMSPSPAPPAPRRRTGWGGGVTGTAAPLSESAAAMAVAAPSTPLAVVEQRARLWLRRDSREQQRLETAQAARDAEWAALLEHPPALYADEAAVTSRFGMGGFVSPHAPGFTGLFRQRWQDFHVTEMVAEASAAAAAESRGESAVESTTGVLSCGGRPLSRDYSFRVPPLPSSRMGTGEEEGPTRCVDEHSFFQVDVQARVRKLQEEAAAASVECEAVTHAMRHEMQSPPPVTGARDGGDEDEDDATGEVLSTDAVAECCTTSGADADADAERPRYLQCTLHKQHVSHSNALAQIAKTLRIHPRSISVAGIKDYVGDTVQRVRLEHVSPAAALEANRRFRRKGLKMSLSDFSYEAQPLVPGDLFGNHFRVVLRDVSLPRAALADAMATFAEKGFANYYGCQRFSWFGGRKDAAFALLRHNWLAFAFLFLNYTDRDRSLRELLQRPRKYPHPSQDEYRRRVVRRLRQIAVEPTDLDVAPFLTCPSLSAVLTHADGQPFNKVEELICAQLRDAYFDLDPQSRRLTAQRLSSFLWNQALTLRLHHIGGAEVLEGDLVAPAALRQLSTTAEDREGWHQAFGDRVTAENRHRYTIEDVVHPGFSFDGIALPRNIVGAYYTQLCGKYALDWMAQHSRSGLRDFREPPRPIIRKPMDLSYEYDAAASVLTLRFALERGCYANVALSELMKSVRCLGSEAVTVLPLAGPAWERLGERDRGYVTTLQDIYVGYEDGLGFTGDEAPVEAAPGSEKTVWDHAGPLFLPPSADPFRKAHRWGRQHLLRNSERREREAEDMRRLLFDRPLARQLKEGEVDTYAGHIVPLPPNASAKRVHAAVMRRKRRYAGSPRMVPRMRRSTLPSSRRAGGGGGHGASSASTPSFQSLNKNSWNFTW